MRGSQVPADEQNRPSTHWALELHVVWQVPTSLHLNGEQSSVSPPGTTS